MSFLPLTSRLPDIKVRTACSETAMKISKSQVWLQNSGVPTKIKNPTNYSFATRRGNLFGHPKKPWHSKPRIHASKTSEGHNGTFGLQFDAEDTVMVQVGQLLRGDLYVSSHAAYIIRIIYDSWKLT